MKIADEHEKSRFFKMQLNKLLNDPDTNELSEYKPIEFFQGDIKGAINSLMKTPLNNWIVTLFKGDTKDIPLIFSELSSLRESIGVIVRMINLFSAPNV